MAACQGRRLIPVMLLICLAANQQRQQAFRAAVHMDVINLLLVMVIDKGLDRCNRGVNSRATNQGWQCARQPSGQTPWPQKATALRGGQPVFHFSQMVGLGGAMCLGESHEFMVAAPLRYGLNAFVNVDSPRLTRMVRTQFLHKVVRQACRHSQRCFRHPAVFWLRPAPSWTLHACLLCAIFHLLRAKL